LQGWITISQPVVVCCDLKCNVFMLCYILHSVC